MSARECSAEQGMYLPSPSFEGVQLIGASFRTADLSVRDALGFTPTEAREAILELKSRGISECMVLSTCNRTEIYFAGGSAELVFEFMADRCGAGGPCIGEHLYHRAGLCASAHLFRVVAGMDSAVLGETEILAQFKDAWRQSVELGASRKALELLCRRALEASKRVRSETDICKGVTSVGSLAVREAGRYGPLQHRHVVLVGAGRIAERVAKELAHVGTASFVIANRSEANAERLCKAYGASYSALDRLPQLLVEADVVITALSAADPVITAGDLLEAAKRRNDRPIVLVDLGVPRNVDPVCGELSCVRFVDMDGLAKRCEENSERRQQALPVALDILDEELKRYEQALTERQASATIGALVQRGEEIRQRNLAWALPRLETIGDSERKVIEDLTLRIVKGMLESPIGELKGSLTEPHERAIAERLFGIAPGGGE